MYLAGFVICAILGLGYCQQQHLPTSQADPCDHPHGVVGDYEFCDRYWECVGGEALQYDCPNGLVFVGRNRGIAEGCDYPWRTSYCSNVRGVGEKTLANPPITVGNCQYLYGIFGHLTSCTRYYTCWNGTEKEQFCIGGLLYNEDKHACDWPENVQGCQKHPLCADDPSANVPLGQSCERYWSCQGGYPRLQRCPATLVFDRAARRCVSPPTIDCDILTTTPHPDEEPRAPPRKNPNRARKPSRQNLPKQEFFEEPVDQHLDEAAPQPPQRPPQFRPRQPINLANLPNLPNLPSGAIPISFGNNRNRPSPIEGAVPLN